MRPIDADALKDYIDAQEGRPFIGCTVGQALKIMTDEQPTIHPEPHWIPVTERLPEENYLDDGYVEPSQPMLVYMSYHACKISRYWGHRKSKGTSDYVIPDWMDLEEYDGDNVVAWRPLPEPYKEVTDGRD